MPSKPKVFLPQDELASDTGGVCPWPYGKLGTHLSSDVHVFLRNYQRTRGEGKGQGENSTGRSALG